MHLVCTLRRSSYRWHAFKFFILSSRSDLHLHLVCTLWTTFSYRCQAPNFIFILSSRPDLHRHLYLGFISWSSPSSCLHALKNTFLSFARCQLHLHLVFTSRFSFSSCLHALIFIFILSSHPYLHLVFTPWSSYSSCLHTVIFILSSRTDLHLRLVFTPWSSSSSCLHALIFIFILIARFELHFPIFGTLSVSSACLYALTFIFILLTRSNLRLYLLLPSDGLCVLLLLQASSGTERNVEAAVPTQKNSFVALPLFTFWWHEAFQLTSRSWLWTLCNSLHT